MGTCFVVMGTTRSGTSVTAGLLHRMGVVMGWELIPENGAKERYDWPDPVAWNPKGWYQDAPLENIQDAIFGDVYPLPGTRVKGPLIDKWKDEIHRRCDRGHAKWGFKTSRIAWLFDEFLEACSDKVKIVQTQRTNSVSVASFLSCWPTYGQQQAEKWIDWSSQKIAAVIQKYQNIPRIEVAFDRLFDDKQNMLTELAEFVGTSVSAECIEFVDPTLRRFTNG